MSRESVLARARAAAEAGMTDTCTVVHREPGVLNQQTGDRTVQDTTVYAGRCRVQQRVPGGATGTDEGEAGRQMLRRELQLPITGTAGIAFGDRVTITACPHDADMVGRVFRVMVLAGKTDATARRIGVEEVT